MNSVASVSRLIELIYEAGLNASHWHDFLREYARASGASGAALLHHDLRDPAGTISASFGIDPEALRLYAEHYGKMDPWIASAKARGILKPGIVHVGEELVPRDALRRTEYYNELAKPFQLSRLLSAALRADGNVLSSISLLRPDARESFGDRARSLLRALLPHLSRALALHEKIATLEGLSYATASALNRLATAVIIVDPHGHVVLTNRAADTILRANDGLMSTPGGIAASSRSETNLLRRFIFDTATARGVDAAREPGGAMLVRRSRPSRPLSVIVTPVGDLTHVRGAGAKLLAALFVVDPEVQLRVDRFRLKAFWNLTSTEAEIAAGVANRHTLMEIASQRHITVGTARWHLKQVFAKTETRSQAELVRLVLLNESVTPPA